MHILSDSLLIFGLVIVLPPVEAEFRIIVLGAGFGGVGDGVTTAGGVC